MLANHPINGSKTIECRHCNHSLQVPFQTTVVKCDHCGKASYVNFFGAVIDRNGNYVY